MKLRGKTAIVTGAARGLGRAYALRLASLGADVVVADINLDAAAEFGEQLDAPSVVGEIERLGRRGLGVQCDLTQRSAADGLMAAAMEAFGRVDILVNNAGGGVTPVGRSKASESPDEDIRLLLDLNFLSTVYCCQAAAAVMKQQGSGIIVNISSETAFTVFNQGVQSIYASAKAAVTQYTRYLAAELGPMGIRANCLSPGVVLTSRVVAQAAARGIGTDEAAARIPMRRFAKVEDCAGVLEFLVTDLSQYVTGQVISVCGGAVLTPS
jgi:NAD(P)-dependent dehydrogenase (short-subunit alcohol dehydrogenase family)